MKKYTSSTLTLKWLVVIVTIITFSQNGFSQCNTPSSGVYTGNLVLSRQLNVNNINCAPAITKIVGNLTINGNHSTDAISNLNVFSSLTEVTGNLTIQNFDKAANPINLAAFASLVKVGGTLIVTGNPSFTEVSFPALASVGGLFRIDFNSNVAKIDVSTTASSLNVGGYTYLYQNGANTSNDLYITMGGSWSSNSLISGELKLLPNKNLKEVNILGNGNLNIAGPLTMTSWATGSAFTKFNAPGIGLVQSIYFNNSINYGFACDVSFKNITSMSGDIHFQNCLKSINFCSLTTSGNLTVLLNPNMSSANFVKLFRVNGSLRFSKNTNTSITSLDAIFSKLSQVSGGLTVTDNTSLGTCCVIPCNLTIVNGVSGPFNPSLGQNPSGIFISGNDPNGNCVGKTSPSRSGFNVAKVACAVNITSFDIDENSGPGSVDDNQICSGASITLKAVASAGAGVLTYQFFIDKDSNGVFTNADVNLYRGTNSTFVLSNTSSVANKSQFRVMVENNGGYCFAISNAIKLTVNSNPSISSLSSNNPNAYGCSGTPVTITGSGITGGVSPYSYSWSVFSGPGNGTFSGSTNPVDFIGTNAGNTTVRLIVTDSKSCVGVINTSINVISAAGNPIGDNVITGNITLSTQSQVNSFYSNISGINNGRKWSKIVGSLTLNGNDATDPITNLCNLTSLTEVTGTVLINGFNKSGNPQSLNDLAKLKTVGCNLTINNNPQILLINLPSVETTGCSVFLTSNTNATSICLPKLKQIKGDQLQVKDNSYASVIKIGSSADSLTFIGKGSNVQISNNGNSTPSALGIDLKNLRRVNGSLVFNNNDNNGVSNFDNIFTGLKTVVNLTITGNDYLSKCCVAASTVVTGSRTISGNTGNCLNIPAVIADCGTLKKRSNSGTINSGQNGSTSLSIYPNPNNGNFGLDIKTNETGVLNITIIDLMGRVVVNKNYSVSGSCVLPVEFASLFVGQYILKADFNGSLITEKLVITH